MDWWINLFKVGYSQMHDSDHCLGDNINILQQFFSIIAMQYFDINFILHASCT